MPTRTMVLGLVTLASFWFSHTAAEAQTVNWSRQYGSTGNDRSFGAIADGTSNTITFGETTGALPGSANAGDADAYVRKYDSAGNLLWSRQYGTAGYDTARGASVDSLNNIYVVGYTAGAIADTYDSYLRKYDGNGNLLWTRQLGNNLRQIALAVHNDGSNNVLVGGQTAGTFPGLTNYGGVDGFLRKYDPAGNELWTDQFGTSGTDRVTAVFTDGTSNTIVFGETSGTMGQSGYGGYDLFLRKYSSTGSVLWTRQYGTAGDDYAASGGLFTFGDGSVRFIGVGSTTGNFGDGSVRSIHTGGITVAIGDGSVRTVGAGEQGFVCQFDGDGTLLWSRQYGSGGTRGLATIADGTSNTILVGETGGTLSGQTSGGGTDAFVQKYDSSGNLLWTRQYGSSGYDTARGITVGANNSLYLAGYTDGSLAGSNLGNQDAYIVKWTLPNLPPVARCHDVTVVAGPVCTAGASINNGSSDPDAGDTITVQQIAQGPFALGVTTPVTLLVTDNHGATNSCQATVTVVDQAAPLFSAVPGAVTASTGAGATTCSATVANLGVAAATDNCGTPAITRVPASNVFPVGTTVVTYTARDGAGNQTPVRQSVTVVDNTPPVISGLTANPAVLSPANHKMIPVTVSYATSDNCPGANTCQLTVSSNQAVNGQGDGNTSTDWIVVDAQHVQLRAETAGNSERVYTITATCRDANNNVSSKVTQVTVPKGH